jgi:hypothetical protein
MICTRIGVLESVTENAVIVNYTLNLYARLDITDPPAFDPQFYVSTDGGSSFSLVGSLIEDTSCNVRYTTSAISGTSFIIKIVDPGNTTVECRFGADLLSSTCPAVGTFTSRFFTLNSNRDAAFTVQSP